MTLELGTCTEVGHVRRGNEDSYCCFPVETASGRLTLLAVADGMGGHQAGEVASSLAVEVFSREVAARLGKDSGGLHPDVLVRSIQEANMAIWRAAESDSSKEGMGTTFVCALLAADGQVVLANVGDSRAYLVTGDQAEQVTTDHSWVVEQMLSGEISAAEAAVSPYRNMLTRSLGVLPDVAVDTFQGLVLQPGQALILCSDGVTNHVPGGDFPSVIWKAETAQGGAEALVGLALTRGGSDNATALVARLRP